MSANQARAVSRYAQVWEILKKEKKVELIIVPTLRGRIIKAVKKRRDLDLAYRLTLADEHKKEWVRWTYKNGKLTLTLQKFLTIGGL